MAAKKKIKLWKARIYTKYDKLSDFLKPLGISQSQFSDWIGGRRNPCAESEKRIEEALKEAKI